MCGQHRCFHQLRRTMKCWRVVAKWKGFAFCSSAVQIYSLSSLRVVWWFQCVPLDLWIQIFKWDKHQAVVVWILVEDDATTHRHPPAWVDHKFGRDPVSPAPELVKSACFSSRSSMRLMFFDVFCLYIFPSQNWTHHVGVSVCPVDFGPGLPGERCRAWVLSSTCRRQRTWWWWCRWLSIWFLNKKQVPKG